MRLAQTAGSKWRGAPLALLAGLLAFATLAQSALAAPSSAVTELLDRAQIENMLTDYYANLGPGGRDMGAAYTPDGVLDVNGVVVQGAKAIDGLYKKLAEAATLPRGRYNMLITNLKIVVHGDSATSENIWTGVISPTPESTPRFVEQGHERDVLVKRHGRWYFKHRVITSDGGLPKMFEKTYRRR
jgi:SnoaL-like domain